MKELEHSSKKNPPFGVGQIRELSKTNDSYQYAPGNDIHFCLN